MMISAAHFDMRAVGRHSAGERRQQRAIKFARRRRRVHLPMPPDFAIHERGVSGIGREDGGGRLPPRIVSGVGRTHDVGHHAAFPSNSVSRAP